MKLHVVLVEPEIPQNTGNVARTCAAIGAELHLVHPLGFRVDDASVRRAGLDYWNMLTVHEHDSLSAFLDRHRNHHLYFYSARASVSHTAVRYERESYLVFGKETEGLPQEIVLGKKGVAVRIPMRSGARCLNLSNAVAVGVYAALMQWDYAGLETERNQSPGA